jgi:hypothetical protein
VEAATRGFDEYNGSGTNTKIIKADVVLDGLRNALAHGNIFTWEAQY